MSGTLHDQPIIIVRRSGEIEDGHHGGAWKIAFADFMTAMMAFFLVMWLISVSDDATKKQIAQYFNPIELNSEVPPSEGLTQDSVAPKAAPPEPVGREDTPGQPGGKPVGGLAEGGEDQALFRDPYAVLAEIVAEAGPAAQTGTAQGRPDGSGLPGLNGGDASPAREVAPPTPPAPACARHRATFSVGYCAALAVGAVYLCLAATG